MEASFFVEAISEGGLATFEIFPKEDIDLFGVSYNGEIIAEVEYDDHWKQVSGEHLPEHIFSQIVLQIESHYQSN